MGFFGRLGKMAQAKFNELLDTVENPIEMCNQHIRDLEAKFREAELATAQVIGNARNVEREMKETLQQVNEWEERIKLAVSKGNDELAKKAIVKRSEIQQRYDMLSKTFETANAQAEKLKVSLKELRDEIEQTRMKRDELEARYKTAEATQKVNEVVANVSTRKNEIQMDELERKIEKKEALAAGLGEVAALKKDNLESEFSKLESEVDLDAELAKYKMKKEE